MEIIELIGYYQANSEKIANKDHNKNKPFVSHGIFAWDEREYVVQDFKFSNSVYIW